MSRTWLITGASSGFGRLLSERVASSGDDVIAVARREDRLNELAAKHPEHISPVALDLTSSQAASTIYAVIRDAGGLDVLVNFFAAPTVTRTALSALRLSQGRIVQVLPYFSERAPAVHVTTIHPGRFGTEFVDPARVVAPDEACASTVGATISGETALPPEAWGDPNVVVDAVLAVVNAAQPPRRLAVGAF
jgi:NAD(P)-dependent dehydrogenase (short-subunit alcohol dehydrogenase family)